jgi:geranyl-CoA carboxylase alpha subunit
VRFAGHAIEVRLCAEDARRGFLPQSGTLSLWQPAEGLRIEHALASGAEVPPHYDSMIAKLVAHGATRDEARRRLVRGLEDTVALGVTTNQAFLARCLKHPAFARGEATTAFIGAHADELLRRDAALDARARALAAVLLHETAAARSRPGARRLSHSLPIALRLDVDGEPHAATLTELGAHRHAVAVGDARHEIEVVEFGATHVRFVCDRVMARAALWRDGTRLLLSIAGVVYDVVDKTRAASARQDVAAAGDGRLRASMNGRVVAVLAQPGERVEAGQPIVTLEAMKMEHLHPAPVAGTVRALHVAVGEQVPAGRVLAEIEPDAAASDGKRGDARTETL